MALFNVKHFYVLPLVTSSVHSQPEAAYLIHDGSNVLQTTDQYSVKRL